MAGLSTITRCRKTWTQDGAPRDVRNDATDAFCLDGNRLRVVSGTYGAANSTYRTELDSYTRITAYGAAGNGPAYFVVEMPDGLKREYGGTTDSRIESVGQSTARAWAINRTWDRSNNERLYAYTEDTTYGDFRIATISWTRNTAQGLSADYVATFSYEPIPADETDPDYVAGASVNRIVRATQVQMTYANAPVRRYVFVYEPSLSTTKKSRLKSLQECIGNPATDCLSATNFTYQDGTAGVLAEVNSGVSIPTTPILMDVSGDGREDVVYASSATSGSGTWRVMLATSGGGYATPADTGIVNTNYDRAIVIDYDANGREDLLVPYSGGTWWVLLGTAAGLARPANTAAPVTATGYGTNARALDVDGDGYDDLVWADLVGYAGGDAIRYRLRLAAGGFSSTVQTLVGPLPPDSRIVGPVWSWPNVPGTQDPDFNADGVGDLAYRKMDRILLGTTRMILPPGATNDATYMYVYSIGVVQPGGGSYTFPTNSIASYTYGDLNGDGRSDLLRLDPNAQVIARYGTGTSFTSAIAVANLGSYAGWLLHDWDGDGFDDVLLRNGTHNYDVVRSTGTGFAALVSTGVTGGGSDTVDDLNGDGLPDVAYLGSGTWRYRLHAGVKADLLLTVTDGFGVTSTFAYLPFTNGTMHTKGSGATFPAMDVAPTYWGVQSLTETDRTGFGTTYTRSYTYTGARAHRQGRGYLGVGARTEVDGSAGHNARTIVTLRQDFPYIGLPASVERQQSSGTRVSLTSNTWAALTYGSGTTARSHPYLSQTTRQDHVVGGASNGTHYRTVTATVAAGGIDATSGLITDVSTVTSEVATGLNAGASKTERTWHSAVFNDTVNWCLGRPSTTHGIQSHTLANGTGITRTSDATWTGPQYRPTQLRVEPNDSTWRVTLAFGYDAFGNLSSQTVTGAGMTARTTTLSYGTRGQFVTALTDALGQTTTQSWNYALGVPAAVTDPNGLTTSWSYDGLGRRVQENRPDLTATGWLYVGCTTGSCDSRERYRVYIGFADAAGVSYRSDFVLVNQWDQSDRFYQDNPQGAYSLSVRYFDARGRVSRVYSPFYLATGNSGYWRTTYDLLDRPTAEDFVLPSTAVDRSRSTAYAGLTVTSTDERSNSTTRVLSAWDDVLRITSPLNGQTNHQVDAFGQLKQVTDAYGNVVSQVYYNVRGMRTGLTDMNLGTWSFTPNALGELASRMDGKSQTTTFGYDALGRPTTRTEAEGTTTWTWGALGHNTATAKYVGTLVSLSGPGYYESYTNDALARLKTTAITSDATYVYDYAYNNQGNLHTLTWPTSTAGVRLKVKYGYSRGYLASIRDFTGDVDGTVYWSQAATDPWFNAIDESYGNGLRVISGFSPITGLIDYRQSGTGGSTTNVQNLGYTWDKALNLTQRQDSRQGLTEAFYYDALNRLDYSTLNGTTNLDVTLDLIGNVTYRSDVGSYTYHATRKHAVTAAGSHTYTYDANGSVATKNGSSIIWSSYNLPLTVNGNGQTAQFAYAPDRSRWRQISSYSGGSETTIYVGQGLEKMIASASGVVRWRHLIPTPGANVQVTRRSDGANEALYVTKDHLGSADALLNASGTVLARASFAAYGGRRGAAWSGAPTTAEMQVFAAQTRRGYTEHEMLDNVGLVHMNGRVYDPSVGRFMSADPVADGVGQPGGFNRYSYVANNPLSLVDPIGLESKQNDRPNSRPRDGGLGDAAAELAAELSAMRGSYNVFLAYQTTGMMSGGVPPAWTMSGLQWLQYSRMNGFRGASGAYHATLDHGTSQWAGGYWIDVAGGETTQNEGEIVQTGFRSIWIAARDYLRTPTTTEVCSLACAKAWSGRGSDAFAPRAITATNGERIVNTASTFLLAVPGGTAARGGAGVAKEIGVLRDAARGKGNFGLGSGTREEAERLGRAWVGDGYKVGSDGKTLISTDGLRQYRPPSFKPNLGIEQANFEQRLIPRGQWHGNGHLDVVGP